MGEEDQKKPKEAEKPEEDHERREEAVKIINEEKEGEIMKSEEPKAKQPPPQEIVLKVYMHCAGCATKVRRCLKGFEGVEDVMTDCRTSKVVVKGEKADPLKVLERLQKKSHRQVELISPSPRSLEEPEKPEEIKVVIDKSEEKKEHPVVTVVLGVYMHCEACAQDVKKRIQRMKGVESVEADLKKSQVTVKGQFEPQKLVDYVHRRTGKHAAIVATAAEKEEEQNGNGGEQEKKAEPQVEKEAKKSAGDQEAPPPRTAVVVEADASELEMKKSESYNYYSTQSHRFLNPDQSRFAADQWYAYEYPPQMFSDENPNACSVM